MAKPKYTTRADGRKVTKITIDGTTKYVYGKTDKEIDEKIYLIRQNAAEGYVGGEMLFTSWAVKWYIANKEGKVSYKTDEMYRNALNNHILSYFKNKKLNNINEIDIQMFLKDKDEYSKSMLHKLLITLKQIFKSAERNGLIKRNPTLDIKESCGVETSEKEPITQEEQTILLNVVKGTRAEIFVNIALFCGLRRGEILALKWSDIDFEKRQISVNGSLGFKNDSSAYEKETKSRASKRKVPFPPHLKTLLQSANKPCEYVVCSATGKQMTRTAFNKMWGIVIDGLQKEKKAGLTDKEKRANMSIAVTPHILRHTYCTSLYSAGIDLKTAQYLMGHSSIEITARIYTHLNNQHIESAQEKLDKFFA